MKGKLRDYILCLLFLLSVFAMAALFLLLPKEDFSQKEKRYLEKAPELSWESLSSGDFGEDAEKYMADHLPFRDFFVGLAANAQRLMGLQVTKDIYVGDSGRLYEAPYRENAAATESNMEAINAFAEKLGRKVDFMLVPSAGYMMQEDISGLKDPYMDDELIAAAYGLAGEELRCIDLLEAFAGADRGRLYYRSDHHWTAYGAWLAYREYMASLGREGKAMEDYSLSYIPGFYGSTYSRSCLWQTPPEDMEVWDDGGTYTVSFSDREGEFHSLFFPERLEEPDKYTYWLDGNHPLVRIENGDAEAEGSLLVLRDSYSNCLGCFLAGSYKTVVLADLRYYKEPLSELYEQEGFDQVLIAYSIGNFLTDRNFLWLE